MAEVLGMRLFVSGYALGGQAAPARLAAILQQVVALVGMDTAGLPPQIWSYPLPDGRGGVGETICQPLVESFIVADTWPSLAHRGRPLPKVYVVLASCRAYNSQAVAAFLAKEIGPVLRMGSFEL